jgi:hypothetical protein
VGIFPLFDWVRHFIALAAYTILWLAAARFLSYVTKLPYHLSAYVLCIFATFLIPHDFDAQTNHHLFILFKLALKMCTEEAYIHTCEIADHG